MTHQRRHAGSTSRAILLATVLKWLALPGLVDAACLVITPYVMEVSSTTAIIRWETDEATTARLCYRPAGEPDGAWMMGEVGQTGYPTTHAASVFGLAPETTYEYKVLTQDTPGASECESDASLVDCALTVQEDQRLTHWRIDIAIVVVEYHTSCDRVDHANFDAKRAHQ